MLLLAGAGCSSSKPIVATEQKDSADIRTHVQEIQKAASHFLDESQTIKASDLDVIYGDVTGDSSEEAIVLIPSGGTAGVTNVAVYSLVSGKIQELGNIEGYKMTAQASTGKLYITEYNPEKPESTTVSVETYKWNGTKFEMESSKDLQVQDL